MIVVEDTRKQINFRKIKAIEKQNKQKVLENWGTVPDESGIYVLTREENGFKYAYIGQAKRLLTRLASHLKGYQHIDLSIKKHGFYSEKNKTGWFLTWLLFPEIELDEREQQFILKYSNAGFQLRNKTAGGQSSGKVLINETKPAKGYRDGLKQGYKNAQKFISNLFKKNLLCVYNGKKEPTKNQEKAMLKFKEFIQGEQDD